MSKWQVILPMRYERTRWWRPEIRNIEAPDYITAIREADRIVNRREGDERAARG